MSPKQFSGCALSALQLPDWWPFKRPAPVDPNVLPTGLKDWASSPLPFSSRSHATGTLLPCLHQDRPRCLQFPLVYGLGAD